MKTKINVLFFTISLSIINSVTAINERNSQKIENNSYMSYWKNMSTTQKVIIVSTGSLIVIGGILYYIYGGNVNSSDVDKNINNNTTDNIIPRNLDDDPYYQDLLLGKKKPTSWGEQRWLNNQASS